MSYDEFGERQVGVVTVYDLAEYLGCQLLQLHAGLGLKVRSERGEIQTTNLQAFKLSVLFSD